MPADTTTPTGETTAVTDELAATATTAASAAIEVVAKPGYKTTEFWLSLLVVVLPWLAGHVPDHWKAIVSSLSAAAYAVSRGIAKRPPA